MNISPTPTRHILIKAQTNAEYDTCSSAIILINDKWMEKQQIRSNAAMQFKEDNYFASLAFRNSMIEFLSDNNERVEELLKRISIAEQQWCYLEVTEEEIEDLEKPENRIEAYQIKFDQYNCAFYSAYAKNDGQIEFWTADFPVLTIIQEIKDHESKILQG